MCQQVKTAGLSHRRPARSSHGSRRGGCARLTRPRPRRRLTRRPPQGRGRAASPSSRRSVGVPTSSRSLRAPSTVSGRYARPTGRLQAGFCAYQGAPARKRRPTAVLCRGCSHRFSVTSMCTRALRGSRCRRSWPASSVMQSILMVTSHLPRPEPSFPLLQQPLQVVVAMGPQWSCSTQTTPCFACPLPSASHLDSASSSSQRQGCCRLRKAHWAWRTPELNRADRTAK